MPIHLFLLSTNTINVKVGLYHTRLPVHQRFHYNHKTSLETHVTLSKPSYMDWRCGAEVFLTTTLNPLPTHATQTTQGTQDRKNARHSALSIRASAYPQWWRYSLHLNIRLSTMCL